MNGYISSHRPEISTLLAARSATKQVASGDNPKLSYSAFEDLVLGDTSEPWEKRQINLRTIIWLICTAAIVPLIAICLRERRLADSIKLSERLAEHNIIDGPELNYLRHLDYDQAIELIDASAHIIEICRYVNASIYWAPLSADVLNKVIILKDTYRPSGTRFTNEKLYYRCMNLLENTNLTIQRGALYLDKNKLISCGQFIGNFRDKIFQECGHLKTNLFGIDLSDIRLFNKGITHNERLCMKYSTLTRGSFVACDWINVDLCGAEISNSDWSFCKVTNTDFSDATMYEVKLLGTQFGKGNKFTNTVMTLKLPDWNEETLEQYFNPADKTQFNLLAVINSIDDDKLKIELMGQVIRSLKNVNISKVTRIFTNFFKAYPERLLNSETTKLLIQRKIIKDHLLTQSTVVNNSGNNSFHEYGNEKESI